MPIFFIRFLVMGVAFLLLFLAITLTRLQMEVLAPTLACAPERGLSEAGRERVNKIGPCMIFIFMPAIPSRPSRSAPLLR